MFESKKYVIQQIITKLSMSVIRGRGGAIYKIFIYVCKCIGVWKYMYKSVRCYFIEKYLC